MPFVLLIVGGIVLIASVRNTQDCLFTLVKGDFTGQGNFIYWVISLLLIGALGYIPKLKPLSVAFLGLVILVLFLTRGNPKGIGGGFFSQFTQQVKATTATASTTAAPASTATAPVAGTWANPNGVAAAQAASNPFADLEKAITLIPLN